MHRDPFAIREGILAADGAAIHVDDIVSVAERKSTRPTRGSNCAFVVMLTSIALAASSFYFLAAYTGVFVLGALIAWYFAWSLRAPCWIVVARESDDRQLEIQFREPIAASRLLRELSQATGGRLQSERAAPSRIHRGRVAYMRGMRPLGIAVFFLGGAIIYGSEIRDLGAAIMVISGGAFVADWVISIAAAWPKKRPPRDVCAICGYSLIGNVSGVCPECGTKIRKD